MDDARRGFALEREAKKVHEAEALREVSAEVTLMMGFAWSWFARSLQEAADRALEGERA